MDQLTWDFDLVVPSNWYVYDPEASSRRASTMAAVDKRVVTTPELAHAREALVEMLLGFWGDSNWLFYAIDPQKSASLVADGVDVRIVALEQDGLRRLGPMLPSDDYHVWCGGRLVLTAGGDRIATTTSVSSSVPRRPGASSR